MAADQNKTVKRRDVERALIGVLKSEQFASSTQLSDFLTFIVTKTLEGKSSEIKAYTIAVDALGRNEDFDPQTNAAVRVAAGRLRQSLALYNAQDGQAGAAVKIILAPGSYVPTFEVQKSAVDPLTSAVENYVSVSETIVDVEPTRPLELADRINPSNKPAINPRPINSQESGLFGLTTKGGMVVAALALLVAALGSYIIWGDSGPQKNQLASEKSISRSLNSVDVNIRPRVTTTFLLPDAPYPEWYGVGEVGDSIELTMVRFDDFQFIGAVMAETFPLNDHRKSDYHMLITAHKRGDNVRMFGKLIREKDGTVIWTSEQLFEQPTSITDRNVPELTGNIFSSLASPNGVIYTDVLKQNKNIKNSSGKLRCMIATQQYFSEQTDTKYKIAKECGEKLVQQGYHLPGIYTALTFLFLDDYLEDRNTESTDPLEAADKMALKAIQYGPQSARAYQAQFRVHKARGHFDSAHRAVRKALALNPYDAAIISDYAAWLISIGDLNKGKELLRKAESLLNVQTTKMEVYKFIVLELNGELKEADEIAAHLNINRSPLTAFSVAISAHRLENAKLRKRAIDYLNRKAPNLANDPRANFIKRGFAPAIAQVLANKLIVTQKAVAQANQN